MPENVDDVGEITKALMGVIKGAHIIIVPLVLATLFLLQCD